MLLYSQRDTSEQNNKGKNKEDNKMMKSKKYDIVAIDNMIGGRQGWAYICNSNRFAVLKADLEREQEYDTYKVYDKVRAMSETSNHRELSHTCKLANDEGTYKLTGGGCFLSSSFGYHDAMELIEGANAPVVRKDDIVAIAEHTANAVILKLYRVGRIDPHCITVATLSSLTEDEMKGIMKDCEMWCDR